MALEWRLRKVMAEKGIWSGSELGRLMKEKAGYSMSAPSISALLTNNPKQMKVDTLDALCTALECNPSDLWFHTPTKINEERALQQQDLSIAANDSNRIKKLPPI